MAHRPKIFIGSSKEGLGWAQQAKIILEDTFDVTLWNGSVFELNQAAFNDLLRATLLYDYGVLVGTADDRIVSRGKAGLQARDNVILELGLFIGRLGLRKCAFLLENSLKPISDLSGITLGYYDKSNPVSFAQEVKNVKAAFLKYSQPGINFFPSVTLASVYYENFIQPTCRHLIQNKGLDMDGRLHGECPVRVVIPERIDKDVNLQFERLKKGFNMRDVKFEHAGRPRGVQVNVLSEDGKIEIVDFPTVISGIDNASAMLLPEDMHHDTGEYKQILQRELERFCVTLTALINKGGFTDMVCLKKESEL